VGILDGKAALITGGSSGIGLATTALFRAEGAQVVVADLRPPPNGGGDAFIEADVADPAAWPGIVEQATAKLGGIDIGYLNAGVTCQEADIGALTDDEYRRVLRVNVDHVTFGTRELTRHMRGRGGGNLIATASIAGLTGFPTDPIYTMTKHAVVGLVRSLGPLLEPEGIRINAVCPGITDTPMISRERDLLVEAGFPLLDPEVIAQAALMSIRDGGAGLCYICQPGREPAVYRFAGIPGPRTPGKEGMAPPLAAGTNRDPDSG
jgi:NAD(P)-dependent dehydrogenase (short-subunit alcohol dehydrogenase family)